jgi:hypothetical protein
VLPQRLSKGKCIGSILDDRGRLRDAFYIIHKDHTQQLGCAWPLLSPEAARALVTITTADRPSDGACRCGREGCTLMLGNRISRYCRRCHESRDLETAQRRDLIIERLSIRLHRRTKRYSALLYAQCQMLTKQLSDRRRGHISNRVRRNALISLSLTPRLGWSRSTVRYRPARAVRSSERSSTCGMPMSAANTTMPASASCHGSDGWTKGTLRAPQVSEATRQTVRSSYG